MKTAENDSFILLQDALSPAKTPEDVNSGKPPSGSTAGNDTNRDYIEIILGSDVPVLCVNQREQKRRSLSFRALYHNNRSFWLKRGNWQFYLAQKDFEKIRADTAARRPRLFKPESPDMGTKPLLSVPGYSDIETMLMPERIEMLNEKKQVLGGLIIKNNRNAEIVTKALVETTHDTALVNQTVLREAFDYADKEAKEFTDELIKSTCDISKLSAHLVSKDIFDNELMLTLLKKSNGTLIQHITRVYLNALSFLAFYNRLVSTTSLINRLRVSFVSKYRNYYRKLLPHIDRDDLTLERVFHNGMSAINPDIFFRWVVGFLLHDIGKAKAIEYYEWSSEYKRDIVIQHVTVGYDYTLHKTNYPREAGLIIGYHHEYYGDRDGYGCYRDYLERYKKHNPGVIQEHCISYDVGPVLDCEAHAYFPAKILEIIDIYDSMTDPNSVDRKAMTPEKALAAMREEFIEKRHKIDVILFDIFCMFIREKQKGVYGKR